MCIVRLDFTIVKSYSRKQPKYWKNRTAINYFDEVLYINYIQDLLKTILFISGFLCFLLVDKTTESMGYFYCLVEYYISVKTLEEKYVIPSLILSILSAGDHVEPLFLFLLFLIKNQSLGIILLYNFSCMLWTGYEPHLIKCITLK